MTGILKSKWFLAAVIIAALVGLYALLGFYAAPRLVRSQAIEFVRENYGRELQIGLVKVHPFKLQLEVRDVSLPDADGQPMLRFVRAFADLQVSSLWKRAFVFREVTIEVPQVRAVIRPDGAMNLGDLALPEDPESADDPLPSIWIELLDVKSGVLAYVDQARRRPYAKEFKPLQFTLQDFRTTPEGGSFRLSASTESGESIEWKGVFALAPLVASKGDFVLTAWKATGISEFLAEDLPFDMTQGQLDLAGSYILSLGERTELDVTLPTIEAGNLRLQSRDTAPVTLDLPTTVVSNVELSMHERRVTIGEVRSTGMAGKVAIEQDGSISLLRLLEPAVPTASPPVAAAAATTAAASTATAPAAAGDADWSVSIAAVQFDAAALQIEDHMLAPVTSFELKPLQVRLSPVTADLGKSIPMKLTTRIDGTATLELSGDLVLDPFAAGLDLALSDLDMRKLQRYAAADMDLQISGGTLATKGRLTLAPPDAAGPELRYAGAVNMSGFKSIDNALEQDFFNFERLELAKFDYSIAPDALTIDSVTLRKPFARIIVGSNQVLNVSAVLDPVGTAKALAERESARLAAENAPKPKKVKKPRGKQPAAPSAAMEPEVEVAETMPIRIREVRIEAGTLDFADFFVQPNFQAQIFALNGTILDVSSSAQARAKIDLKGKLDEFAPVTIAGELRPFAFDRYTDIQLRFENILLPVLNPYSGRLAGYRIAKGKLTTDLDYLIENRALTASHHIRIDQLEWGEKTATKDGATLPVRFATALLKDRDGVINLDLPITGTLDDPKFRIGPIVWQIVKNILTKAVTAPFALIGSLFKGAEDAQFVDFAPGDATLSEASTAGLVALGKGLVERPAVRLDIPITALPEVDRPALQEQAFSKALEAGQRTALGIDAGAPIADYASLPIEQRIAIMTALVQQSSGVAPQIPPPPPPPEGTKGKEAKQLEQAAALEFLEAEARRVVVVDEAVFAELAEQRARSVQSALLRDTGLDPQRVFLERSALAALHEGRVRLELQLK